MVARLPMPISISPSPVMTRTPRRGCASAKPSPIIAALPMAPQSGKLSGSSPAAVMSQLGAPSPPTTRRSPRSRSSDATTARRSSVLMRSIGGLFLEALGADELLGEQHGDGAIAGEGEAGRTRNRLAGAPGLADTLRDDTGEREALGRRLSHRH